MWPHHQDPIIVEHNGTYAVELPGNPGGPRLIFSLPQDFLVEQYGRTLRIVRMVSGFDYPHAQFSLRNTTHEETYYIVS
jgi:hypothetical protein